MDELTFRKGFSAFKAFADNLPKARRIAPEHVQLYLFLLDDIARETGQNLDYFRVPAFRVYFLEPMQGFEEEGRRERTEEVDCDRATFLIKLNGALNFFTALLDEQEKRLK